MLRNWKNKNNLEKTFAIIGSILAIIIIILAVLNIFDILNTDIYMLLCGFLMVMQTINSWKKDKTTAYISLATGLLLIIIYIALLII